MGRNLGEIARLLNPDAQLTDAGTLGGGISYHTQRATLQVPGELPIDVIIREAGSDKLDLHPRHLSEEFALLEHLASLTSFAIKVPNPLLLLHNENDLPDCVVFDFTPGEPAVRHPTPKSLAPALAETLAALHQVTSLPASLSFLVDRGEDTQRWPLLRPTTLDDSLREGLIRDAMASFRCTGTNRSSLLHGDFWPGNIILNNRKIACIVDWEDALFGEPLNDLAIARLDLLWCYGHEVMQSFTDHYLSITRVDAHDLPYWDLFAALRPCGYLDEWCEGWAAMGRSDVTLTTLTQQHYWFVDEALARNSFR
ncbi:MAG: aminoglycoside phosphotransferase family protein [Pseudomonadota bacterium]